MSSLNEGSHNSTNSSARFPALLEMINKQWLQDGSCALAATQARAFRAVPIDFTPDGNRFMVAISKNSDLDQQDSVRRIVARTLSEFGYSLTERQIDLRICQETEIASAITELYPSAAPNNSPEQAAVKRPNYPATRPGRNNKDTAHKADEESEEQMEYVWDLSKTPDLATQTGGYYLFQIAREAVRLRATDIHIQANGDGFDVLLRIDGVLQPIPNVALRKLPMEGVVELGDDKTRHREIIEIASRVVGYIKSNSSIGHKSRLQQESGRAAIRFFDDATKRKREYDLRIEKNVPVKKPNEEFVIRLLDKTKRWSLPDLSLSEHNNRLLRTLIAKPYGAIIFTGPTGAGKSTTQYACLQEMNDGSDKIMTVEDPVEYSLEGISQVQINEKAGVTFPSTLRSFLRQDPDVILVGEMRDLEVTNIAMNAAKTGHLVLTTLHTNESADSFSRLASMGVEFHMITSSIVGVLAQRLVRKVNPDPKFWDIIESDSDTELKPHGYRGENRAVKIARARFDQEDPKAVAMAYRDRVAVYEIMVLNSDLFTLIEQRRPAHEIRAAARKAGMITMWEDGLEKVGNALTTIKMLQTEVIRFDETGEVEALLED